MSFAPYLDYPFVDPSDDLTNVFADAYLAHENRDVVLPLRISRAANFDGVTGDAWPSDPVIEIRDAADSLIFDSSVADYTRKLFGSSLVIHEWLLEDTAVFRLTQYTAWDDDTVPPTIAADFVPVNGVLDERVSELLPKRVTTLTAGLTTFRDSVVLQNGFNTELFAGVDLGVAALPSQQVLPNAQFSSAPRLGGRNVTRITLSAKPGDGLGKFPGCDTPEQAIKRVNNVAPDNRGNFTLDAGGCYWVRQPLEAVGAIVTPVDAQLKLGNDCGPCCECSDFEQTYLGLINVHGKYAAIGERFKATRTLFTENIERWENQRACRQSKPVRLAIAATGTSVDIAALYCNMEGQCITDLRLDFTISATEIIESSEGVAEEPESSATSLECLVGTINNCYTTIVEADSPKRKPYVMGGEFPDVWAAWGIVESGSSVSIRFRVKFPNCPFPVRVKVCVSATLNSESGPIQHPQVICEQTDIAEDECTTEPVTAVPDGLSSESSAEWDGNPATNPNLQIHP